MVFHWSLSDSKSLQVFRILLSILAYLNNAVVWKVSTRPLISNSSSPFINPLVTVPWAPFRVGINVTFIFHSFPFPNTVELLILLLTSFTIWSAGTAKFTILQVLFFFFVDYYEIWLSGQNKGISKYLKITEEFVILIFRDIFWVVHISLLCVVNFKFLAQFTVDHPVVSSLILFLR